MFRTRLRRTCFAGVLWLVAAPIFAQASSGAPVETNSATDNAIAIAKDDPALQAAEILPRARDSLLLDVAKTDSGFFVVGERGHILNSTDGLDWQQRQVPTRSTLTTLAIAEGQLWAAGHDGVIVHSADAGRTWQRQRATPWSADNRDPSQGVPILDLLFTDAKNGIAVGAYSLMLVTRDGGITWVPKKVSLAAVATAKPVQAQGEDWNFNQDELLLEDEADPHLNAIARSGSGGMAIVGERGTFLNSRDGGETWKKLAFPYQGSMFGVLAWEGDHLLAFGLRGKVYESDNLGVSWHAVETKTLATLMGGVALADGGAILVGANGALLMRKNGQSPFILNTFENAAGETPVLANAVPVADGNYLLVSDKGVDLYSPK